MESLMRDWHTVLRRTLCRLGCAGRPPAARESTAPAAQRLDTAVTCTATTRRCSGDEACPACAYWRAKACAVTR